jgi:hypothetical protein
MGHARGNGAALQAEAAHERGGDRGVGVAVDHGDLQEVGRWIRLHHAIGLDGKDLPHGYTMKKMAEKVGPSMDRFGSLLCPDLLDLYRKP